MTDGKRLKDIIKQRGVKLGFLCEQLKLSRATFRGRLANKTEFTASEILILSDILNLDANERDSIFFAHQSELNSLLA